MSQVRELLQRCKSFVLMKFYFIHFYTTQIFSNSLSSRNISMTTVALQMQRCAYGTLRKLHIFTVTVLHNLSYVLGLCGHFKTGISWYLHLWNMSTKRVTAIESSRHSFSIRPRTSHNHRTKWKCVCLPDNFPHFSKAAKAVKTIKQQNCKWVSVCRHSLSSAHNASRLFLGPLSATVSYCLH